MSYQVRIETVKTKTFRYLSNYNFKVVSQQLKSDTNTEAIFLQKIKYEAT